jgi:ABC-type taurine transport system substrate-binding protein
MDLIARMIMERQVLGCIILDVITFVGLDRVVLLKTYKEWDSCTKHVGFTHLPYQSQILANWRGHILLGYFWKPTITNFKLQEVLDGLPLLYAK